MTAVSPSTPAAPYIGGKRNLAARIVPLIAGQPHETYAEPFVGMGGVFLRRPTAARCEVVNDASRDVATFFRILQRHYPQFMDTLRFQLTTRAEFQRLQATDPSTLTDLERAARFLYLQSLSFGGKVSGRTFGVSAGRPGRFNLNTLGPRLEELHERLAGVIIECLDFEEFLGRYDRPGTLFYIDPPYDGTEGYYGKDLFGPADLDRLAGAVRRLKGRFILSINDTPRTRALFAGLDIREVPTTWSAGTSSGQAKAVGELIVLGGGPISALS